MTRAKAQQDENAVGPLKGKTALQSKKVLGSTTGTLKGRTRALGDITNASKPVETQDTKKAAATKAGATKVAPKTNGIQKPTVAATRTTLGPKDSNAKPKTSTETKRKSGSGGITNSKKRTQNSVSHADSKEPTPQVEEQPAKKSRTVSTAPSEAEKTAIQQAAKAIAEDFIDLDAEDQDDPLMVAEYVSEIFKYYLDLEPLTMPNPDYMEHQDDLEWKMRGILIDWLIEVHTRFRLLPETLFLAVNIIDRFLSQKVVPLDKLQLVGVTAMFIASKYEEVLSPHIGNFVHVADDGFTVEEVLSAERYTLSTLKYDLSYPNPMNFLRRISKADNYDIQTRTLGKYLLEISLLDHRFMKYRQSQIAAAAMYLARTILDRGPWDATLAHYAGYTEDEIQPVFQLMISYLHGPVIHEAFFKKYASKKFLKGKIFVLT